MHRHHNHQQQQQHRRRLVRNVCSNAVLLIYLSYIWNLIEITGSIDLSLPSAMLSSVAFRSLAVIYSPIGCCFLRYEHKTIVGTRLRMTFTLRMGCERHHECGVVWLGTRNLIVFCHSGHRGRTVVAQRRLPEHHEDFYVCRKTNLVST